MKSTLVLLLLVIASPGAAAADLDEAKAAFEAAKQRKDKLYAEKTDCPGLMGMLSEDVIFWEKGREFSYEFLVEYCPQLPRNVWQPVASNSQRFMLGKDAAYEILTETLIHPDDGATYRRTTTEIWERSDGEWKIIHLNIGLHQVDDAAGGQR